MPQSRRSFLKKGAFSAMSAGLMLGAVRVAMVHAQEQTPPQSAATMPLAAQTDPVFLYTPATFKPYVGSIFTAPDALGARIPMTLLSLTEFTPRQPTKVTSNSIKTTTFSLIFKAEAALPTLTSIHKMSHPALGDFSLFLTKIKSSNGDRLYEAVINHIP